MNLKELESRLQTLIEVDLLNALPGRKLEDVIVQKLAAAIHQNALPINDDAMTAPDVFTLVMHPVTANAWQEPQLLTILLHSINVVAQEAGMRFAIAPTLTISTDDKISPNDAQVVASYRMDSMAETSASPLETGSLDKMDKMPENAFLIVEGVKMYPLNTSVVNIGRRLDNHLVIDDPRVSRNHAQLRAIKGRFVLFDLNSTGGTFVNGQRTSQSVLYPGDVISLAGVALIFGQDNPPQKQSVKNSPTSPNAATDRPTAHLKDRTTANLKRK